MSKPTKKQIDFAERICYCLGIKDFPHNSKQFTKQSYRNFIDNHINEFMYVVAGPDEDDLIWTCENDVWCEHY